MSLPAGYRRKAAAGRRGIVLISGEAGVRKSSLLRQFELNVDGGRAIFASARCVEFIQTPLGPLRELLKQVDRNSSLARDAGTRALLERLSFERGAEGTPAQPASWLLESIDAAFARHVQRGILVLLIEDVHWADRCNQSEERHVERGARSSRNLYEIRRTRTYGEVAEWLNAAVLKCLQLTSTGPRKYHLSTISILTRTYPTLSCLMR